VPPCPADNSKQQQLIEKSDGHENGAMMITGVHIVTLMASATILAPSAPSSFDARFRLVIAPLSLWVIHAEIMMAPPTPRFLKLKSASVIPISRVAGSSISSPKMSADSVLFLATTLATVVASMPVHPEIFSSCICSSLTRQLISRIAAHPARSTRSPALPSSVEQDWASCASVSLPGLTCSISAMTILCSVSA
jgi:hypothetical protein